TYFSEIPYIYAWFVHNPILGPKGTFQYDNLTLVQFLISGLVMLLPAGLLGAAFPLALQVRGSGTEETGPLVGRVYAYNTVGAILGAFAGGFLLVPNLGIQNTLLAGIALNAFLGVAALILSAKGLDEGRALRRRVAAAVVGVLGVFCLFAAPRWNSLLMARGIYKYALDPNLEKGDRDTVRKRFLRDLDLVFYREGITTTGCVVDEGEGNIYLATNGKVDASSIQDMPTQVLLAQIPMNLAPRADQVMVIGFASGTTVGSVLLHPLESLVALEIEPAIIEASRFFNHVNNRPLEDRRLRLVNEDGRNYLAVTERRFDLIISEPSNPWMTIASNLFTKEYYESARERLNPGGCYCQWLQLYALRPEDMKCIASTFLHVFPHTYVFYSKESVDLMLLGSAAPFFIDVKTARERLARGRVTADLDRVGVYDVEALLAHFIAGPEELKAFCDGATLNTDDNARIEFSTPKTIGLNRGGRIQKELLDFSQGVSSYLRGFGETPEDRAVFLLNIAVASETYGEGVSLLTSAFARNALAMAPRHEPTALVARELLEFDDGEEDDEE
ncbi:MAG: spermidine synthase, partial [Planctomycetota bacterium]